MECGGGDGEVKARVGGRQVEGRVLCAVEWIVDFVKKVLERVL